MVFLLWSMYLASLLDLNSYFDLSKALLQFSSELYGVCFCWSFLKDYVITLYCEMNRLKQFSRFKNLCASFTFAVGGMLLGSGMIPSFENRNLKNFT